LTLSLINVGQDRAFDAAILLSGHSTFLSNSTSPLGVIPLGAVVNSTFFIRVPTDTAPGSYPFNITLTYKDFSGRSYVTHTPFDLSVVAWSPPDVSITNVLIDPPVLSTGTQGAITIFLNNFGTTEARNVNITISGGSGIFASSSFGVGTIQSGGK